MENNTCECGGSFGPYIYDKTEIRCDLCARPQGETRLMPDYRDVMLDGYAKRVRELEIALARYESPDGISFSFRELISNERMRRVENWPN